MQPPPHFLFLCQDAGRLSLRLFFSWAVGIGIGLKRQFSPRSFSCFAVLIGGEGFPFSLTQRWGSFGVAGRLAGQNVFPSPGACKDPCISP